jgi:polar amino acid transport system substrate-binding protein
MRCEATHADSTIGGMSGIGRFTTAGVTLLVLAATAAALVTPAGGSSERRDALPTRLPGTLTVALDIGTIGLAEGAIVNGRVVRASGFEIDLARALARKLGVELRIVDIPFAQVVRPGSKPFDVSISHVTITAKRAKSVDFSPPYFVVNKGVLVAPGVAPPATLTDLRKLRVCAQAATTSIAYVRTKLRPRSAPRSFPSPIDALRALSDGFCQAMVADLEILVAAKRDQLALYGPIAGQIITNERYGAVFEKRSRLRGPVSSALRSLVRAGVVTRLATRWFGTGWDKAPVLR